MTTFNESDLQTLQQQLTEAVHDEHLNDVAERLNQLSLFAGELSDEVVSQGAGVLAQLVELAMAVRVDDSDNEELCNELVGFVANNVCLLRDCHDDDQKNTVTGFIRDAESKWSEYLVCLDGSPNQERAMTDWDGSIPEEDESVSVDVTQPDAANAAEQQIELLLSAVTSDSSVSESEPETDSFVTEAESVSTLRSVFEDDEMREAFLDDATRCLDSMEKSSLAIENCPEDTDSIHQFCRELHTLKGASASAGLAGLAEFIHEIESSLTERDDLAPAQTAESMLEAVDRVREVISEIKSPQIRTVDEATDQPTRPKPEAAPVVFSNHSTTGESLIRIRASKLDRLMDMLAELVVLRNRRESHIAEFSEFNEELARCASRLSFCHDSLEYRSARETSMPVPVEFVKGSNTIQEISKDISVVSNSIRELQKPVAHDNLSISHFIRDFRQELMQLRRVPIAGLFSRLQRAARDVARKEEKSLQLICVGEKTGLEQELQEKLYEPLLHIIRNAVSHGIEASDARSRLGKDSTGTITLEAQSNSQLLAVEVRDDGRGLDYDAIRRRGIEKGLISGDRLLSDQELGHMIFHPGFSTCDEATQVSGRGVGMDVVSTALEQMRGRIEIDSKPGQGTTMRLVLPLRSAIEHVMVIRVSGQLFGVPMQTVAAAARAGNRSGDETTLPMSSMLSLPSQASAAEREVLMLRNAVAICENHADEEDTKIEKERLGLEVDEIIGPEEVVVRNLPGPLSNHPLFCGLTLSGAGETMLLLDGSKLVEYCNQFRTACQDSPEPSNDRDLSAKRILVVDDSLSARKMLVKKLSQMGFRCTEAGDGIEALQIMRREQFDLVFTDLDMPRLGGLEMLFDMQQHGRDHTPVVVVSSRSEEEFRHQAIDYGAFGYLTKPVDFGSLQNVLDDLELSQNNNSNEESDNE